MVRTISTIDCTYSGIKYCKLIRKLWNDLRKKSSLTISLPKSDWELIFRENEESITLHTILKYFVKLRNYLVYGAILVVYVHTCIQIFFVKSTEFHKTHRTIQTANFPSVRHFDEFFLQLIKFHCTLYRSTIWRNFPKF